MNKQINLNCITRKEKDIRECAKSAEAMRREWQNCIKRELVLNEWNFINIRSVLLNDETARMLIKEFKAENLYPGCKFKYYTDFGSYYFRIKPVRKRKWMFY